MGRESWREGYLNKTRLLSPTLSSFLRQEERERCSAIGLFFTCADTNGADAAARLVDSGLAAGEWQAMFSAL